MRNPKGAGRKRVLTPLEEMDVYARNKNGEGITDLVIRFKVSASTIKRIIDRIDTDRAGTNDELQCI